MAAPRQRALGSDAKGADRRSRAGDGQQMVGGDSLRLGSPPRPVLAGLPQGDAEPPRPSAERRRARGGRRGIGVHRRAAAVRRLAGSFHRSESVASVRSGGRYTIGRGECRESGLKYGKNTEVCVTIKKKK